MTHEHYFSSRVTDERTCKVCKKLATWRCSLTQVADVTKEEYQCFETRCDDHRRKKNG
jgi:hypothetical protein